MRVQVILWCEKLHKNKIEVERGYPTSALLVSTVLIVYLMNIWIEKRHKC